MNSRNRKRKLSRLTLVLVLSWVLTTIALSSGCTSMASEGAIIIANKRFNQGEYEEAIDQVERSLRTYEYSDEIKAKLLFIKSISYGKLGDPASAISILEYIVYKYPETEYGFRSITILKSLSPDRAPEYSI